MRKILAVSGWNCTGPNGSGITGKKKLILAVTPKGRHTSFGKAFMQAAVAVDRWRTSPAEA